MGELRVTRAAWAILALVWTSATALPQTVQPPPARIALVIGNAAYKSSPLINPTNDAEDMSAALSVLGFRVTTLKNASLRDMKEAIRNFGAALKTTGGTGLFYFAGHGVQSKGRNYLIPSNANISSEADIEFEAVDAYYVLALMEEAKNRVNLLILDACRDNPYARGWRSATRGLAQMDAPSGTFIAYATAPGQGAADGSGRNGLYTKHLLASLRASGSSVEDVFKRVAADVASVTGGKQVPWTASSLTRDFYFRGTSDESKLSSSDLFRMARDAERAGRAEEAKTLRAQSDRESIEEQYPGAATVLSDPGFKLWLEEQPANVKWLASSTDPNDTLALLRMFGRNWLEERDRIIESKHPGWKETAKTVEFKKWLEVQTETIKKLAESALVEDAITVLDAYRRSR